MTKVKITSPSFSKNKVLIEELRKVLSKKNYELFANDSQKRLEGNDLQIFLSDAEIAVIALKL
jgi:hypothetical protein